ncbi:hypothetical protein PVK06_036035 [Gossypium arboreum]|uniref:Uncharacterized protein n=1 Tax=Gossypium arboreum TaxID=29729 RepID=A0ABR0NIF3_GOSAR|nr:hypothetical protein PVK06_036035 [Gossypium arboreum]
MERSKIYLTLSPFWLKTEVQKIAKDKLPYPLALKADSNFLGKEIVQMGVVAKKMMSQCFYTGEDDATIGKNVSSDRVAATMGNTTIALVSAKKGGVELVFFMEMKLDERIMKVVRKRCGFVNGLTVEENCSRGGLYLAWKEGLQITLKSFSKNHIDMMVEVEEEKGEWRFTGFYGLPFANRLCKELLYWARKMKDKRANLKRELTSKLDMLMNEDHDDENLLGIIDFKIQLNLEIDKDEFF